MRVNGLGAFRPVATLAALTLGVALAGAAAGQTADAGDLVGVWQGYEVVGGVPIGTEAIFRPQGTYQKTSAIGQLMAWQEGRWEVVSTWVHLYPMTYGPTDYMGTPMAPPPSETWVVDYFDGASLHATVAGANELVLERTQ